MIVVLTEFAFTGFRSCRLIQGSMRSGLSSKMHESGIHRDPMQPCRKRRLTTEGCQLSERLNERFLSKVVSISGVICHAQTHRIHASFMDLEERRKRVRISVQRSLHENTIGIMLLRVIASCFNTHSLHVFSSVV